jgi:diguanylate cyclase (GGDEF)-like protein
VDSGIDFAERLRRTIEVHDFSHDGQKISITISLGIAAVSEFTDKRMRNLISLADQRLYQAKSQGRNQVVGGKQ